MRFLIFIIFSLWFSVSCAEEAPPPQQKANMKVLESQVVQIQEKIQQGEASKEEKIWLKILKEQIKKQSKK